MACLLTAALLMAAPLRAEHVTVFAAASLKSAFDELGALYAQQTGHSVVVSFAGSSALARQIEHGAPADIFVSANTAWMDRLEDRGLIDAGTRFDFVANRLALVAHEPSALAVTEVFTLNGTTDLRSLLDDGRLAMALVDAVPAGIYGRESLETLGLWSSIKDRVAQSDNVRSALALVASGEAPLGIVYRTDALAEARVTRIAEFPIDSHGPIRYPAAALRSSDNPLNADFLAFLRGAAAAGALEGLGFLIPER